MGFRLNRKVIEQEYGGLAGYHVVVAESLYSLGAVAEVETDCEVFTEEYLQSVKNHVMVLGALLDETLQEVPDLSILEGGKGDDE